MQPKILLLAGCCGGLALVAGTFGAHGLEDRLTPERLATFETGVRYHMYHSLALLACSGLSLLTPPLRWAVGCFLAGVVLFSGSLYLLAVTDLRWLGMITPAGGVLFIIGWGLLAVSGLRHSQAGPAPPAPS